MEHYIEPNDEEKHDITDRDVRIALAGVLAVSCVLGAKDAPEHMNTIHHTVHNMAQGETKRVIPENIKNFSVVAVTSDRERTSVSPSNGAPIARTITDGVVYELNQMKPDDTPPYTAAHLDRAVMVPSLSDCIEQRAAYTTVQKKIIKKDRHTIPIVVPVAGEEFCSLGNVNQRLGAGAATGAYFEQDSMIFIRKDHLSVNSVPHEIGHALGLQHDSSAILVNDSYIVSPSEYAGRYSALSSRQVDFPSHSNYFTASQYAAIFPKKYPIAEYEKGKTSYPVVVDGVPTGVVELPIPASHPLQKKEVQQWGRAQSVHIGAVGVRLDDEDETRTYTDVQKPVHARDWRVRASVKMATTRRTQVGYIDIDVLDREIPPEHTKGADDYVVYYDMHTNLQAIARVQGKDITIEVLPIRDQE